MEFPLSLDGRTDDATIFAVVARSLSRLLACRICRATNRGYGRTRIGPGAMTLTRDNLHCISGVAN